MDRRTFTQSIAVGAITAASGVAFAKDDKNLWGNLTATFVYDGEPPEPIRLRVDKDEGVAKGPIFSRDLVVDAKSKGIGFVCIWLHVQSKSPVPKIHPDYAEAAKKPVTITFSGLQLEPHIVSVRTGQTLIIDNLDPLGHNPSEAPSAKNSPLSRVIAAGGPTERVLKHAEPIPYPIACSIHPWESARVLVKDHPYVGISNRDGKVVIKNLPVGKHTFAVWQESGGFVSDLKRDGKPEKWKAGRVTIDIKPGDNDLGKIEFIPAREKH
jgi:hypothetical protein